jgi:pimeloyl-ACP methyl ester carboxylesterase
MPFITIRGVRLHYRVFGEGGPWATLTTGGRRAFGEFIPLAGKLSALGFRVLLHDRRNTGASDIVIDGADGEEEIWADDLHALLVALGAKQAFIGGSSSGARMSLLYGLRHKMHTAGLLLFRVTGGAFAAGRLPEQYYGRYIEAARQGGMAAVCDIDDNRERIAANPANGAYLMKLPPEHYIEVMTRWLDRFQIDIDQQVMGINPAQLATLDLPAIVIPGNDNVHSSVAGKAAHRLIPGSQLHQLPIEDQDVDLIPFADWAEHEDDIAHAFAGFMRQVWARRPNRP